MQMQRTRLENPDQILNHGFEFEGILTDQNGKLLSFERLCQFNADERPDWLDYEFLALQAEIQSDVFTEFNSIAGFITETQNRLRELFNRTGIMVVPFSGIFDSDFEVTEEYVSKVAGRGYYQEAWQNMLIQKRQANIRFNRYAALHVSVAIPASDIVRMFNIANFFINPFMALLSSYSDTGHCERGMYWRFVDHTIKPLWIDSLDDYDEFINKFGMPFQGSKPESIVHKGWPWIRIKQIPNGGTNEFYRLELAMGDMSFLPQHIEHIAELMVRLMSIFHFQRPDFYPEQFEPSMLDQQNIQLANWSGNWRDAVTQNFQNESVQIEMFLRQLVGIVVDVYDALPCTDFVTTILDGAATGAERIRSLQLADHNAIRVYAFNTFTS
ncbi:MAG: hypothetical protein ACPGO5_03420 [Patescibacteria group bacterium]